MLRLIFDCGGAFFGANLRRPVLIGRPLFGKEDGLAGWLGRHHRTHRTKWARLVSPSNYPRHVGRTHAPSPVEGGRSPGGKE